MKKILTLLFVVALSLCIVFALTACEKENSFLSDDTRKLTFSLNDKKDSYELKSVKPLATDKEIIIPSTYLGLPVTSIGKGAFGGCEHILKVEIPDSVSVIKTEAFAGCTELLSVKSNLRFSGPRKRIKCGTFEKVSINP